MAQTFVDARTPAQAEYQDVYLRSWRWWATRLTRVAWDKRCRTCPNKDGLPLHVHHAIYDHRGGDWIREWFDVITVCQRCHRLLHGLPVD